MKRKERPDRISCPLSIHCLRLLDELDMEMAREQAEPLRRSATDPGEQLLLARLRSHLPACSICSTLVAAARSERDRQRRLLRTLLEDAERRTPATTGLILSALRDAQLSSHEVEAAAHNHHRQNHHSRALARLAAGRTPAPLAFLLPRREPARRGARASIQEMVALLAMILLMLLSTGFVAYFLIQQHGNQITPSITSGSLPALYHSNSWSSVLMLFPSDDGSSRWPVYNYDPFSGQKTRLPVSCCDTPSAIDGIAHNGRDLLYHQVINGQTVYSTLNRGKDIFTCSCNGSASAIWTTDDRSVLVDTGLQILQINPFNQALPLYSGSLLQGSKLTFYHNDFLYFERSQATLNALYRLDLASGEVQLIATAALAEGIPTAASGTSWLLSPTGSTIYYTQGSGSNSPIYAVDSDGSNAHPLQRNGIPLGFAEDNSLLFLQPLNGRFAVKKLAATPQQDQVVLANAVPEAVSLPANGLALSPYGESLIAEGLYADHSLKIWISSLLTGAQKLLLSLSGTAIKRPPQPIGWDQLPATTSVPATVTVNPVPTSDDWNGLLLASAAADGSLTLANYNYANGHVETLLSKLPKGTQIDGISPDGATLAYHILQESLTNYYLLAFDSSPPAARLIYRVSGSGGNAIWENASTLLINTSFGIVSVDAQRGTTKLVRAPLTNARLTFYREPYLYFVGQIHTALEALYRVPLGDSGATPQAITPPTPGSSFWLSPDGYTIYYLNHRTGAGIYAVDSDGQNSHRLRPSGVPIGYAADNSLVVVRYIDSTFEVVRLGLAPSQDEVLLRDAAPGASKLCGEEDNPDQWHICTNSIALAPYGHHLVVQAGYSDGHHALLAYNLDSGQQVFAQNVPACLLLGYNRYPPA